MTLPGRVRTAGAPILLSVLLLLLLLLGRGGWAAAAPAGCVDLLAPTAAALPADGSWQLAQVRFQRLQVFPEPAAGSDPGAGDPGHSAPGWLQRPANRWHRVTAESALQARLLVQPGDRVDQALLAEAERDLRRLPYLYDAQVLPERLCGDQLWLLVITRDLWTLLPDVNLDRSGGESSLSFGFSDSNLYGSGKAAGVFWRSGVDRDLLTGYWRDPNLAGSRLQLGITLTDADDGGAASVDLRKPFLSLAADNAWGLSLATSKRLDGLSFRGQRLVEFDHQQQRISLFRGFGRSTGRGRVQRWYLGYSHERDDFDLAPGRQAPAQLADDRRFSYPWVALEVVRERWASTANLDKIGVPEDLNLGHSAFLRLGWSSPALGGDHGNILLTSGRLQGARMLSDADLLRWRSGLAGRWQQRNNRVADLVLDAGLNWRHAWTPRSLLVVDASWVWTRNLSADRQLLLGGDSGLRGYPLRYQAGDRRWLLSAEQRWLGEQEVFGLVRLGWALFADVGRAWFAGGPSQGAFGVLANLGIGLRLQSTRTEATRVVHLDLAVPVQDGPRVPGAQVLVTVRNTL